MGLPVLHEDDALRAVRAAVGMRAALIELNRELEKERGVTIDVRTGVNTGEVVAGDASKGQTLATGEAINRAARLQQAAASGDILIGAGTHRLVRAAVRAEPVEALPLKGKAEPVRPSGSSRSCRTPRRCPGASSSARGTSSRRNGAGSQRASRSGPAARIAAIYAHSMKQATGTGIGRALRTARERRGKTLEEASRETRLRTEYLQALEQEWFEALGSDVYVRGFLRTYAKYLGLSHHKVITAYEHAFRRPKPGPAPVERSPGVTPTEVVVLTEKKRPNWLLASGAALIALAAAGAIGLLSRGAAAPTPATLQRPPDVAVMPLMAEVGLKAHQAVDVEVVLDGGEAQRLRLEEGQARNFVAHDTISIRLSEGGLVELIVNGRRVDAGERHAPFQATYTSESFRGRSSGAAPQEEASPSDPAA